MTTVLLWILGLLAFLVVLIVSVGLHEGGHMVAAKAFKLSVPKFFVGFGKTIWSFKTKKTEYGFKMIPLGGFVEIHDSTVKEPDLSELEKQLENPDITDVEKKKVKKEIKNKRDSFIAQRGLLSSVAPWKRIIVYLAGPAVNLVLGTVIILSVLMGFNSLVVDNTVDRVNSCATITAGQSCEAEKAGVQKGDKIVAIDGQKYASNADFSMTLQNKDSVNLTVERDGKEIDLKTGVVGNLLGVDLTLNYRTLTLGESFAKIKEVMVLNIVSLSEMPEKIPGLVESTVTGSERDPEAPSSIVNAGKTYGDTSASKEIDGNEKIRMLLIYSGLLNFSLFAINAFLPFLPLDGGRIFIALIDQFKIIYSKILRRKYTPVGEWEYTAMTMVTGVMVLGVMALLIVSDVAGIARGQL